MQSVRVAALFTYPVKSCAGLRHERIELGVRGPAHDREWMVVDEYGMFVTQRELPRMSLIQPAIDAAGLSLTAPNMPALRVPFERVDRQSYDVVVWQSVCRADDEGDEAAHWLSAFLGVQRRLVRIGQDHDRLTSTSYTDIPGEVSFADGYPLLFISKASLADLNDRLVERGASPVPMNRFRPNVVVAGCDAYAEDSWKHVRIGDIDFDVVKPCARCVITTVDQAAGESLDPKEPLATLATYRRGPGGALFGQNVIHRGMGAICVGDSIDAVVYDKSPLQH